MQLLAKSCAFCLCLYTHVESVYTPMLKVFINPCWKCLCSQLYIHDIVSVNTFTHRNSAYVDLASVNITVVVCFDRKTTTLALLLLSTYNIIIVKYKNIILLLAFCVK